MSKRQGGEEGDWVEEDERDKAGIRSRSTYISMGKRKKGSCLVKTNSISLLCLAQKCFFNIVPLVRFHVKSWELIGLGPQRTSAD